MIQLLLLLLSLQLCPTLCDPIDGSPPGSPVPGILQERTLEWVAISFSNAWKWKVKVKSLSLYLTQRPHGLQPARPLPPWDFPGKRVLEWGAIAFSEGPKITQREILITLFGMLSNMGNVVKWVIMNTFRLYYIDNYYYIKLLKVSWHLMCHNSSYCIKILYATEITTFYWQLYCNQIICLLTFMGSYCFTLILFKRM